MSRIFEACMCDAQHAFLKWMGNKRAGFKWLAEPSSNRATYDLTILSAVAYLTASGDFRPTFCAVLGKFDVDEIQRESLRQDICKTICDPLLIVAGPDRGQGRQRGQISHVTPQTEYFFGNLLFLRQSHRPSSRGTPWPGS